jgi:hypothetical protein
MKPLKLKEIIREEIQKIKQPKMSTRLKELINKGWVLTEDEYGDQRVKNPETGREIKVKTALSYGPSHPAYKVAQSAVTKSQSDKAAAKSAADAEFEKQRNSVRDEDDLLNYPADRAADAVKDYQKVNPPQWDVDANGQPDTWRDTEAAEEWMANRQKFIKKFLKKTNPNATQSDYDRLDQDAFDHDNMPYSKVDNQKSDWDRKYDSQKSDEEPKNTGNTEKIRDQIQKLELQRAKLRKASIAAIRANNWDKADAIDLQIDKLEKQIDQLLDQID